MGSHKHTHVMLPLPLPLPLLLLLVVAAGGCALLTDLDNLSTKPNGSSGAPGLSDGGDSDDTNRSNNDGGGSGGNDGGQTISQNGRCDVTKSFASPVALDVLNDPGENDRAIRLSPDELTVYFSSDRDNSNRIYRATRSKVEDAFGAPVMVSELHQALPGAFNAAVPSINGLELLVEHRVNLDGGNLRPPDIFLFTRAAASGPFSNPTPLTGINTNNTETDPNFGANDLELYLARPNNGNTDIFVARRAAAGAAFGPSNAVPGSVNTNNANESDPVLSVDGLELFFQSDRGGSARVWVSRRQSVSEPFPVAVHVSELDGPGDNDVPNWLSPDRCSLYMTSYRQGNLAHLYVATRPR